MYPPKYHQENDFQNIISVIQKFPLATLISANGEECLTTHLPLIYQQEAEGSGKLFGHMDKNNPQCKFLDNKPAYAIFHGPDAYISPKTYITKNLPTWNYIKVHIKGAASLMKTNDEVIDSMIVMTKFLEKGDDRFVLERANTAMNHYINYVTGFEIRIESWEGKFKLSQDKTPADIDKALEKLVADNMENLSEFVSPFLPGKSL
jgi:transcriptional regulator